MALHRVADEVQGRGVVVVVAKGVAMATTVVLGCQNGKQGMSGLRDRTLRVQEPK